MIVDESIINETLFFIDLMISEKPLVVNQEIIMH